MKRVGIFFIAMLAIASIFLIPDAGAVSGYFTSQGCSGCHGATPTTCNGCHQHGAHGSLNGAINVKGATSKTTYAPGETITVTITGGFKSGWIRAILYDQNMTELARSTGPTGTGGGAGYPVTLTAPAPSTPGTYTWNVSWYGNYVYNPGPFQTTCSGAITTNCWRPSSNPNHGEEIVATNSFTVASAAAPAISVTDSVAPTIDLSVPFGSVNTGSSANQTVTVTNTGNANLLVGAIGSTNALAAPFSITNNTCSNQTIAPSASCTLTIAFAPAATGAFTDSFNIPSNDPAKSSVTMNVSGTGAAAPTPAISVTDSVAPATDLQVPFGSIIVGSSASQTVTVTNTGNADLLVGAIGSSNLLAAPYSVKTDSCSNHTLTMSASCTITLGFAPTSTGSVSDSFNIPSNDPAKSSVTVNVNGSGSTAQAPVITVTDSVAPANDLLVPFGTVSAGGSAAQTVTIANSGNASLVIGTVGSMDPLAEPFSITADGCSNRTIAPAASCTLTISFAPTAAGTVTDSFNVPSSDPAKPSVTVSMSGTGTAATVGRIGVTDSVAPGDDLQIPFGSVREGRSMDQDVTIANAAGGDLVIGTIASANPLAAPFSVASDSCSGRTLSGGNSCTLTVRFTPPTGCAGSSGGGANACTYSDSFDIPSSDPDKPVVTMQVSGSGASAIANNPPDRPRLRHPADHERDLGTSLDMSWDEVKDPDGDHVNYELRISTDANFSSPVIVAKTDGHTGKMSGSIFAGTGLGFIFFGFVFAGTARGRKGLLFVAAMTILVGSSLVGCSSGSVNMTPTPVSQATITQHVSGLQTSTTYYWKVVASDGNGGVAESDVSMFSTK